MMAALFFMPRPTAAWGNGLRWPLRVLYLLWIALLAVWAKQTMGWVPAVFVGIIWLTGENEVKRDESWSGNGLALISTIILVLFVATEDRGWLPAVCILGPFLLLAFEPKGRRDLKKNVFSIRTLLWVGVLSTISYWIYIRPSLSKATILTLALLLWFGNLLYHLSSARNASPHAQQV